jgi:hypothetical protein
MIRDTPLNAERPTSALFWLNVGALILLSLFLTLFFRCRSELCEKSRFAQIFRAASEALQPAFALAVVGLISRS